MIGVVADQYLHDFRRFSHEFLRNSDQKYVQQVTLDDPNVTSKLDFLKPINFFIHGWLGFIHPNGTRWFENEGKSQMIQI